MRRWRKTHRLTSDQRAKDTARSYASVYRARGQMTAWPCQDCGGPGQVMHHPDYSRPLAIIWLCEPCHGIRHGIDLS